MPLRTCETGAVAATRQGLQSMLRGARPPARAAARPRGNGSAYGTCSTAGAVGPGRRAHRAHTAPAGRERRRASSAWGGSGGCGSRGRSGGLCPPCSRRRRAQALLEHALGPRRGSRRGRAPRTRRSGCRSARTRRAAERRGPQGRGRPSPARWNSLATQRSSGCRASSSPRRRAWVRPVAVRPKATRGSPFVRPATENSGVPGEDRRLDGAGLSPVRSATASVSPGGRFSFRGTLIEPARA